MKPTRMHARANRTTLGDWNNGACGNANNCRYTGGSPAYTVEVSEGSGPYVALVAFNRRWAAEGLAAWANRTQTNLRHGDPVLVWIKSDDRVAGRYARDDNAKEV